MVVVISFAVVWAVFRPSFNGPLSSTGFPLTEKWGTTLRGNIEQITTIDNRLIIARTMTEINSLDQQTGNILWRQNIAWHFSSKPVFAMDGMLLLTDGKNILALDQADGRILWQQPLRNPLSADIVDINQDLVAVTDLPFLAVYRRIDGSLLWKKEVCRGIAQAYFYDANIIVPCFGLASFNALSGETVWETKLDKGGDRIWKSTFSENIIYFSQDLKHIMAYDVKNQRPLWESPMSNDYDSYQAYKVNGNHLLVIIDEQLCVLDRKDGSYYWCTEDLVNPENPTVFEDVLYLFNGFRNGITAYDVQDGRQLGRLEFPSLVFINFENEKQLMISSDKYLIFSSGQAIYSYGH